MPDTITTTRLRNAFASIQDAVCAPKVSSNKEIGVYYSASHAINISAFALLALTNSGVSPTTITSRTSARTRVKHATAITTQSTTCKRAADITARHIASTSRNRRITRLTLLACLNNAITTIIWTGNTIGFIELTLVRYFWGITK
jgi:protease II